MLKQIKPIETEKASITIRQAVEDLIAVENMECMRVSMHYVYYYRNPDTEICSVCFAGAVMKSSFSGLHNKPIPNEFDPGPRDVFISLDSLREYDYLAFLYRYPNKELGNKLDQKDLVSLDLDEVDYENDRDIFKSNMLKIADELERLGF